MSTSLILIIILSIFLFFQYFVLVTHIYMDYKDYYRDKNCDPDSKINGYKPEFTKKEILLNLIPFYWIVGYAIPYVKKTIINFKEYLNNID